MLKIVKCCVFKIYISLTIHNALNNCHVRFWTRANDSTDSEGIHRYQFCWNTLSIDDFMVFWRCHKNAIFEFLIFLRFLNILKILTFLKILEILTFLKILKKWHFWKFWTFWDLNFFDNFHIFSYFWKKLVLKKNKNVGLKKKTFFLNIDRKNIFWRVFDLNFFLALLHVQNFIFRFFSTFCLMKILSLGFFFLPHIFRNVFSLRTHEQTNKHTHILSFQYINIRYIKKMRRIFNNPLLLLVKTKSTRFQVRGLCKRRVRFINHLESLTST